MFTRRDFLAQTTAGLAVATSARVACIAQDKAPSKPAAKIQRGARIKQLIRRDETTLRYPIHGDNWHMTWAADDRQYAGLSDGYGPPRATQYYNSRLLALSGSPQDATFNDVPGYPFLSPKDEPGYYGFGVLALDGKLFQFLSTFKAPFPPEENPNFQQRFVGAKLIYSPDNGRTWCNQNSSTPVVWEGWSERSREALVFFEESQQAFSLLSILQMGRNYEANKDGYVYVYAPNGNTDGTMNELVMFRVPKGEILDRKAYEYFAGLTSGHGAKWTKDIDSRSVVQTFPRGWVGKKVHPFSWMPSVTYNIPLGLYMMASWGIGSGPDGMWFEKPSYLGFWTAHNPWGPWTQIHEETAWMPVNDSNAGAYTPLIAPKWIAPDGKSFWLVWTDFQKFKDECDRRKGLEGAERIEQTRKCQPYYAFNVQRVDILAV